MFGTVMDNYNKLDLLNEEKNSSTMSPGSIQRANSSFYRTSKSGANRFQNLKRLDSQPQSHQAMNI